MFQLFFVFFLPVVGAVGLLGIKVVIASLRQVRSRDLFVQEVLEVEVFHPHMLLHLHRPIESKPVGWLPLEALTS